MKNTYMVSPVSPVKTDEEQHDLFFYSGHPLFLIPDFGEYPDDVHQSFLSFLEKTNGEVWDQDGGEVTLHKVVNQQTGLTKCVYEVYGVSLKENDDPIDYTIEMDGYVVVDDFNDNDASFDTYCFLVEKIEIKL